MSVKTTQPQHKSKVAYHHNVGWTGRKGNGRPHNYAEYEHLITEDEEPVDNIFSERQQRLLTETLHANWDTSQQFLAFANVGLFHDMQVPAIVPDVMLSMDVRIPDGASLDKHRRSYFIWDYGKPPDIVIEIVSNRKGDELTRKVARYEQLDIPTYVVFDPAQRISNQPVTVYRRVTNGVSKYAETSDLTFPNLGLALTLWEGAYQEMSDTWLRWCTLDGTLIQTGKESSQFEKGRANAEQKRANLERERADSEQTRANAERDRANAEQDRANEAWATAEAERKRSQQLLAKLLAAGIDPDTV